MNTCPVCGYDRLEDPPTDFNICPCCGTEFGYHDANFTHAQLRQRWIAAGAPWWAADVPPPPDWDPIQQLTNMGYGLTDQDRVAMTRDGARSVGTVPVSAK